MNSILIIPGLENTTIKVFDESYKEKNVFLLDDPKNEAKIVFDVFTKIGIDNIKNIILCTGPGRFMSLRIFCTIVNTLTNEKNIKIYSVLTYEYLSKKVNNKYPILLQLNQTEVLKYFKGKKEIISIDKAKTKKVFYGFLRNHEYKIKKSELLEDGILVKYFLTDQYKVTQAIPFYGKE